MTDAQVQYSWSDLTALLDDNEGAVFIAHTNRFRENVAALRKAFSRHYGNVSLGYSYKTNHLPELCRIAHQLGMYAEVVSGSEYVIAQELDVPGRRILFNGPTKFDEELHTAFTHGALINIDSASEASQLARLAEAFSGSIRVGLRCNLDISWKDRKSRFGLSEESGELWRAVEILAPAKNVVLEGLHCHTSFDRSASSYGRRVLRLIEIADQIFGEKGPEFIDIGGGLYGPMSDELRQQFSVPPATFDDYAEAICAPVVERYGESGPELIIEPGVALLGNVFDYAFRVEHVKKIGDDWFAMTSGASHHIKIVPNNFNLPTICVPNPRAPDSMRCRDRLDIVGYTCLEHDILYRGFLQPVSRGDVLVTSSVGAYSMVSSPDFIRTSPPVVEKRGGGWRILRRKVSMHDYLSHFSG